MLFNSIEFLLFFPVVTALFFLLPHQYRWVLLLGASCFFYMFFKPEYILILVFTIIIDYYAGILLENETNLKRKKLYLMMSIIANVGVLAIFKYFNFLNNNITGIANVFGVHNPVPALRMLLPIGLSFHTFQAMSYTIEVYRGNQKAERHFGIYALYVMFYPQLVAGPIERPQNILYQFRIRQKFSYENAVTGLKLIVYGLFKKIVIADRLAEYVNQVYGDIGNANSISAILAVCFFSFQIYCDFSGYSDIARGTAKFMGYDLLINFNRPYLATTISEFWSRWHISLSTWFRDYLYIPIGGNRKGKFNWYKNIFIVFVISGLWHGANWTFIVWGALHGFYNIFGLITKDIRQKIAISIGMMRLPILNKLINQVTIFVIVTFAWIFFRAENFNKAYLVIHKLFEGSFKWNLVQVSAEKGPMGLLMDFFVIGLLLLSYRLPKDLKVKNDFLFLFIFTFLIIILGKNGASEFIYFQF